MKLQLIAKFQKIEGGPFGNIKKIRKDFEIEIFERCHSTENCERGDPLGFFDIHCVAKYLKIEGETLWWHPKSFKKSRIVPKKNPSEKHQREDPMLSRSWTSMFLFWTRLWRFEYVLEVLS